MFEAKINNNKYNFKYLQLYIFNMSSLGFENVLQRIVYNQEQGTTVFNVQRTAYIGRSFHKLHWSTI